MWHKHLAFVLMYRKINLISISFCPMGRSSPKADLPAGIFLHPMVLPSRAVYVNSFKVLVKNECLKETGWEQ